MARRRFFVSAVRNGEAEISGEDALHLTRVLRVEVGQRYEISDNSKVFLAEIASARKQAVTFRILEALPLHPPPVQIVLCAALIKFDHFEWMIEKATELGVERIIPLRAERSDRGLDQAVPKRLERWRRVAVEASQQSRRDCLPEVSGLADLGQVLDLQAEVRLACDEQAGTPPLLIGLPLERRPHDSVAVLVGPEGGWTDGERAKFLDAGWNPVSLGPQILRAETAALSVLAVLIAAWHFASVQ